MHPFVSSSNKRNSLRLEKKVRKKKVEFHMIESKPNHQITPYSASLENEKKRRIE